MGAILNAGALYLAGEAYRSISVLVAALHVPLAVVEGFVTANVVLLLRRVRPELLDGALLPLPEAEVANG